jgi:predicted nucleic acid-binding protein
MAHFLLDTNILSALEDPDSESFRKVYKHLSACDSEDEIFVSVVSIYEYQYGIANASDEMAGKLKKSLADFEAMFTVIPLNSHGAEIFGRLKSAHINFSLLPDKAAQRHTADMIIASSAIEMQAKIVSNDKIFARIAEHFTELQVENWM